MAKLGDLIVRVGADTREFNRELGRVQRKIRETSDNIMDMGKAMSMGVTLPIAGLGAAAVKAAADLETMETQFISLTGGAEQAAAMVDQLNQFAAATPFQIEEIAGAARQLIAAGTDISQVNEQLQFLGDIAATSGASIEEITAIFAKVQAKGKVELENLNQLAERGIPIFKALSDATGLPANELGAGAVSVQQFNDVLRGFAQEGGFAAGAMERLSQTAAGKFSTAMDNLKQAGAEIGRVLLPYVTAAIDKVTELSQKFMNLDEGTQKTIVAIAGIAAAIGPGIIAFAAYQKAMVGIQAAMAAAKAAGIALNATLLTNPITAVAVAIAAAIALIIANWDQIHAYFTSGDGSKTWDQLKQTVMAAVEAIQELWQRFVTILKMVWDEFGDDFIGIIGNALDMVFGIFRGVFGVIGNLFQAFTSLLKGDWRAFFGYLGNVAATILQTVVRTVIGALEMIGRGVDALLNGVGINSNIGGWLDGLQSKTDAFFESIKYKADDATESVEKFSDKLAAIPAPTLPVTTGGTGGGGAGGGGEAGPGQAPGAMTEMPSLGPQQIVNPLLMEPKMMAEVVEQNLGQLAVLEMETKYYAELIAQHWDDTANAVFGFAESFGSMVADVATGSMTVGEMVQNMVVQTIKSVISMIKANVIANATNPLNPANIATGGIASPGLIVAGLALVEGFLNAATAFAEGGIVSGPTLGLVGEYQGARTNPEVIAPLDKLRSMMGGMGGNVVVTGRLDGRDILLSSERSTIDRYRTRGY
ncbi:MAG: tape measure protein [Steroidobacteraceae bacterium]